MTFDLEDRLRTELARDASRAQLTAPEWNDLTVVAAGGTQPRHRLSRTLSIAAALMLVAAGAVAIASRQTESPATGFVPPGEEFPLTELSLADVPSGELPTGPGWMAKPGSVHIGTAPGLGWLMIWDTVEYAEFSSNLHPFRCMAGLDGQICQPIETTTNGGSSHGERSQWVNLPPGTTLVGYVDGTGKAMWQRPLGDMSVFPRVVTDGDFTAYADDGTVLATINFAAAGPGVDMYATASDSLTDAQRQEIHRLSGENLRNCINEAGATYPFGQVFPILPAGAADSAWDFCIVLTNVAVEKQSLEWGLATQQTPTPTVTEP